MIEDNYLGGGSGITCSNNDLLRLITVISDLSGLLNRPERSEGYLRPEGPISL